MYKRVALGILASMLMMSLTGCLKNDFVVQIHEDSTADIAVDMMLSEEFMSQIGMDANALLEQAVEANTANLKLDTVTTSDSSGTAYGGVRFSKLCTSEEDILSVLNNTAGAKSVIDDSLGAQSETPTTDTLDSPKPDPMVESFVITTDKSLFSITYTVNTKINPIWASDVEDSQQTQLYDMKTIVKSNLTITLPGKITTKDSAYVTSKGVEVDLVSLEEPLDLTVTSKIINTVAIAIALAIVSLTIVLICGMLSIKKLKSKIAIPEVVETIPELGETPSNNE